MSQENVEVVRSIYADWERGDFTSAGWAHPEIEYVVADGPNPGTWTGLTGLAEGARTWLSAWEEYRIDVDAFRELDGGRVLALTHGTGRGKASGMDAEQIRAEAADLFYLRDGKVTKFVVYFDRQHALADLGLSE
jgi:ketosteroid isomerase-like protein